MTRTCVSSLQSAGKTCSPDSFGDWNTQQRIFAALSRRSWFHFVLQRSSAYFSRRLWFHFVTHSPMCKPVSKDMLLLPFGDHEICSRLTRIFVSNLQLVGTSFPLILPVMPTCSNGFLHISVDGRILALRTASYNMRAIQQRYLVASNWRSCGVLQVDTRNL